MEAGRNFSQASEPSRLLKTAEAARAAMAVLWEICWEEILCSKNQLNGLCRPRAGVETRPYA